MKAILLAAGEGTRLRPYTNHIPKPMITLGGKPLLEHNILLLQKHSITEIIINLHYHPEAVTSYFGDGSKWGVQITYSYEAKLLGTAGAVKNVSHLLSEPFFVLYADNLSGCNLTGLEAFHRQHGGIATIAVYECLDPSMSGILEVAADGRVQRFIEKPKPEETFGNLANGGLYVLDPSVLELVPPHSFCDFGHTVFPALLKGGAAMFAWKIAPIITVDTANMYEETRARLSVGTLRLPGL